ncbi:MAG: Uma2 family endonuclease, partial [Planctomycetia bacterium]
MTTATTVEIDYPSSDGQPMAETGIHVQAIILLHQALEDFFQGRPDVFIASDMFWYWKEGDSTEKTAPDVMVVPGVGNHDRRSYFSWEEGGAVPAVVFE